MDDDLRCVLCDWWMYSPLDLVRVAYRPGSIVPLWCTPQGVREADLAANVIATIDRVALAAHWGDYHPDQLRAFIGDFEVVNGFRLVPLLP
jgi:hypothetical protein